MIAALDHSRMDGSGSSKFLLYGVAFGWEVIQGMLQRELRRKLENKLPRIPKLRENYVHRDSWTRLNVAPAKIMQVRLVYMYMKVNFVFHALMYCV